MYTRYQVFVSSTYLDLIDERKEATQAILKCECFPAGMELFPAANINQWELIKRVIDESDFYLLIIAGRYGSFGTDDNGKRVSYTEMEFDYAILKGKPIIVLLHRNPELLPSKFVEKSKFNMKCLKKFREKAANGRMVAFWENKDQLHAAILDSLHKAKINTPEAIGWVRKTDYYESIPEKETETILDDMENVEPLTKIDIIEISYGLNIIPLADDELIDHIILIRRKLALELGIIVPFVRFRYMYSLNQDEYIIKIKDIVVGRGEILIDHYMAINPGYAEGEIEGYETNEPLYGLPAMWISKKEMESVESLGYCVISPATVIATYLTGVLQRHAYELLDRQQVHKLINNFRQQQPSLVDDVFPKKITFGELQKILCNLLHEGISIRDLNTIVETIDYYSSVTRDVIMLTEYIRQELRRTIIAKYAPEGEIHVITLAPEFENKIIENIRKNKCEKYGALYFDENHEVYSSLRTTIERVEKMGIEPVVLCSKEVRFHLKNMIDYLIQDIAVLSYNELQQKMNIIKVDVVI